MPITSFTSLLMVRYMKGVANPQLLCFEPVHDLIVLLIFGTGIKKFLILLMLVDYIKHAFIGAIGTIKNFSFPV